MRAPGVIGFREGALMKTKTEHTNARQLTTKLACDRGASGGLGPLVAGKNVSRSTRVTPPSSSTGVDESQAAPERTSEEIY